MSYWEDVHIKQMAEITITAAGETHTFGTTINRKNDNSIFFPMPSSQHAPKAFKKGIMADILIHADNKYISFVNEISAIHPGTPPNVQINRQTDDQIVMRQQLGQLGLRLRVNLTYRIMRDPVTPISDTKKAYTTFLGSGDCIIISTSKMVAENYIEMNYTLDEGSQPVTLVGRIMDTRELKEGNQSIYEAFIKYDIIRPGEQDKIMKYIFDKQRSLRKRELY